MAVLDLDATAAGSDVHAFSDGDRMVLFVSSLQAAKQTITLNFGDLVEGMNGQLSYNDLTATRLGVAAGSTDSSYRGGSYADPTLEPDADLSETSVTLSSPLDGSVSFNLANHGVMVLEIDLSRPPTTILTNASDTRTGTHFSERIEGLRGGYTIRGGAGTIRSSAPMARIICLATKALTFCAAVSIEIPYGAAQAMTSFLVTGMMTGCGVARAMTCWMVAPTTVTSQVKAAMICCAAGRATTRLMAATAPRIRGSAGMTRSMAMQGLI